MAVLAKRAVYPVLNIALLTSAFLSFSALYKHFTPGGVKTFSSLSRTNTDQSLDC
jgi:hypothetical protein